MAPVAYCWSDENFLKVFKDRKTNKKTQSFIRNIDAYQCVTWNKI